MITESAPFKPTATSGVDGSRTTNPIQNNPTASSGAVPSSSSNANGALLSNLWTQLDHIQPTIPDRLSVAILEGAGVQMENSDPRLARLVSLAGQKFLTDILSDAMLHWRLANGQPTGLLNHPGSSASSVAGQVSTTSSAASQNQPVPQSPSSNARPGANKFPADRRATLTLEDLIASLNDRGIHIARPPYYR